MTAMQLTVMALLLIIAALFIVCIHLADCRAEAERKLGVHRATWSTRRRMRAMRRDLANARMVKR